MSIEMRVIKTLFGIRKKLGMARLGRKPKLAAKPAEGILKLVKISSDNDFGFELNTVTPPVTVKRVIIYLHGGGYVNPIAKQHWQLIAQLSVETGAIVLVPRYGLAPEHNVSEALEFVSKVFARAKELNLEIIFVGDSAGGGLAAASIAQLGIQAEVSKLVLISPWLGSDFDDPELPKVEKHDPWLIPENLREIAKVWSGNGDHQDPRAAPIRGEFAGFPKTFLMIGAWDVLLFDSRVLRTKFLEAGVEHVYEERKRVLHVYPLLPTPEGVAARRRIVGFITGINWSE
jgi:monoterpene epsilon-lactone hydrolase